MLHIEVGRLFAMFSFDVGYEIDLSRLPPSEDDLVRGRKSTPARVRYPSPFRTLALGTRTLPLAERVARADVTLRVHAFGAVTVRFAFSFDDVAVDGLPALMATLTAGTALDAAARTILRDMLPSLRLAILRPADDETGLVEDYYVVQVSRFAPVADAPVLLGVHRDLLARIVHCEPHPLSPSETDEVVRTAVTYRPDDLVVTDWNVALVFDAEWEDAVDVLELLNVQLLELRFLDAMLDRRINALYDYVGRPRRWFSFRREIVRVRELAELRLDTATLRERLVNAVKLVGDLYLTKIYARTADRLHLDEWQRSIDGKLELVQKISDVLASRTATARAELLELTVILLIMLEIVLFIAH